MHASPSFKLKQSIACCLVRHEILELGMRLHRIIVDLGIYRAPYLFSRDYSDAQF